MASLGAIEKKSWTSALRSSGAPWIACGLGRGASRAEELEGMPGLIDWELHGQVSSLLAQGRLPEGELCLIPGGENRPSFLLYRYGEAADVKFLVGKMKSLQVKEVSVAETTFPGDFLAKLKQNLGKEGIRCTKLEPDSHEPLKRS